jgi:hypothetical protein
MRYWVFEEKRCADSYSPGVRRKTGLRSSPLVADGTAIIKECSGMLPDIRPTGNRCWKNSAGSAGTSAPDFALIRSAGLPSRGQATQIDGTRFAEDAAGVRDIMGASTLPVLVDADDGYGHECGSSVHRGSGGPSTFWSPERQTCQK